MDHLTTIIVHYNAPEETLRCIESTLKAKHPTFDHTIMVIDNGSKEPFLLPSKWEKLPNLELVRSEANLGFAGGNNLGIKRAVSTYNTDYVVLLNSDATIEANAPKVMVESARNHPEVGIINPKIYFTANHEFHHDSYTADQRGSVIWFGGGSVDWNDLVSFHRGVDEIDRGQFEAVSQTDFATGCCMLIRREVIESVGLLSEDLFLYWEDVEYSLRVVERGYRLLIQPKALAWHDNASSGDGAGSDTSLYYQTRNRLVLAVKNGGWAGRKAGLRLAWRYFRGKPVEQKAVIDAIIGKMGKQPLA